MNYKKDMLLILTIALILGLAIQTMRVDLISILSSEESLSEKTKAYYFVNPEEAIGTDGDIKGNPPVFYELYDSLDAQ